MCVSLNPEKLLTSRQLKKNTFLHFIKWIYFTQINVFILKQTCFDKRKFNRNAVLVSNVSNNIYINNMAIYENFIHLNIWHLCEIWSLRAYQNSLSFLPSLQLCQILISTIGKFWEILMSQSMQCVFCSAFT